VLTNPWQAEGEWLKGALHVHTTNSDGALSPQEVAELYRRCGYDFVVFTDHERVTPPDAARVDGMTIMSGAEVGAREPSGFSHYHLLAVGLTDDLPPDLDRDDAQAAIDALLDLGALVYLAHPYWSLLDEQHMLALERLQGVEVFNAGCEYETRHGDSSQHWDWGLAHGKRWQGIAVDDAHVYEWDACGGWVVVKSRGRSPADILAALRDGCFYSSAGPTIHDLRLDGGTVRLAVSQVAAAHLIVPQPGRGWTTHQLCKRPPCEQTFTQLDLPLPQPPATFRIEVVDDRGRKAWTNPICLE